MKIRATGYVLASALFTVIGGIAVLLSKTDVATPMLLTAIIFAVWELTETIRGGR